jgi:hypothetical protein
MYATERKTEMKKLPALAVTLLVTAMCSSACAPAEDNGGTSAPISLSPGSFPAPSSEVAHESASGAALTLQSFFTAVDDETDVLAAGVSLLDHEQITKNFPRSLRSVDASEVNDDDADRLIREYSKNIDTIPNRGYVGIDPKTLQVAEDGTVNVSGEDLFIAYKDGAEYVTHKGASMVSDDSLNDVFTLTKTGGTWKITKISF